MDATPRRLFYMKLIIQNINGVYYAYRETEKHHRAVEKTRDGKRLDPKQLDEGCDLTATLPPDTYMVIDIK